MQIAPYPSGIKAQFAARAVPLVQEVESMRRPAQTFFSCALLWLTSQASVAHRGRTAAGLLMSVSCLLVLTACGAISQQRVLYQSSGCLLYTSDAADE